MPKGYTRYATANEANDAHQLRLYGRLNYNQYKKIEDDYNSSKIQSVKKQEQSILESKKKRAEQREEELKKVEEINKKNKKLADKKYDVEAEDKYMSLMDEKIKKSKSELFKQKIRFEVRLKKFGNKYTKKQIKNIKDKLQLIYKAIEDLNKPKGKTKIKKIVKKNEYQSKIDSYNDEIDEIRSIMKENAKFITKKEINDYNDEIKELEEQINYYEEKGKVKGKGIDLSSLFKKIDNYEEKI